MELQNRKILVTGSHGFLGGTFIESLKKEKIPFVAYDRARPKALPADIDTVVHFAGLTPGSKGRLSPAQYKKANVECTDSLLKILSGSAHLTRFINIGSCAEYGFSAKPLKEGAKERPVSDYGVSKLEQSRLVARFARARGVKTINLRIFNVAGVPPRSAAGATSGKPFIFETLVKRFKGPRVSIRVTNQENVRDYVDTGDVMNAILSALTTKRGGAYEIINVCSGRKATIRDLAAIFGEILNQPYVITNQTKVVTSSIGDSMKARKLLGWKAGTPLKESIRRIVQSRLQERLSAVG